MTHQSQIVPTSPDGATKRTVAAIRSHRPGPDVDRVYNWLSESMDPGDIFIVADETRGKKYSWPQGYQVVTYDENFLNELSIFNPGGDVGWRCGDYCYFALEQEEQFEYLWMIEPDVVANFPFSHLLDETSADSAELVSASLRERDRSWSWHSPMARLGYDRVYSVFFPLTRVSRRLIELIRLERSRMSDRFLSGDLQVYPNDESVTATVAISRSCSYTDLKEKNPEMFSHFLWGSKWLYPDVLSKFDRPKLIHPVLTGEGYADYLRKLISGLNLSDSNFKVLGTSMWSISAANYPEWRQFVVGELARRVDQSVFNR